MAYHGPIGLIGGKATKRARSVTFVIPEPEPLPVEVLDQDFPVAAYSWTMAHPWGLVEPFVVATRDDGAPLIVGPEYSYNSVTVTFVVPTAGHMTLYDPDPAELTDDVVFYGTGAYADGVVAMGRGQGATVAKQPAAPSLYDGAVVYGASDGAAVVRRGDSGRATR